MLIKLIKSFYFDFALSDCPSDIIHLFLSTNVFLFDALTIAIHHFVLFVSVLSQKEQFYVERKNNTQSSCMIFFSHLMSDGHIFEEDHYLSKWYDNEYKQHLIYYSAIQSSV